MTGGWSSASGSVHSDYHPTIVSEVIPKIGRIVIYEFQYSASRGGISAFIASV